MEVEENKLKDKEPLIDDANDSDEGDAWKLDEGPKKKNEKI